MVILSPAQITTIVERYYDPSLDSIIVGNSPRMAGAIEVTIWNANGNYKTITLDANGNEYD